MRNKVLGDGRRLFALLGCVGLVLLGMVEVPSASANTPPPPTATLSVTPTSGGPGTVIAVKSVTPCSSAGQGVGLILTPSDPWPGTNVNTQSKAGADGSWVISFTLPSTVNVSSFRISAGCSTLDVSSLTVTNTLTYIAATFTVTSGGSSPPVSSPPVSSPTPSGTCR